MNNTPNRDQIDLQTTTNFNNYQITDDEQTYLSRDSGTNDNLSSFSTDTHAAPIDSENEVSNTEGFPFGIKQFWYCS